MTCGARARILPGALLNNLAVIRKRAPGTRIMAAVKGNAYGHGLDTVARTLADADSFAVARLSEAEALRNLGISKPVVLLTGVLDADELERAVRCDCELVVHTRSQVELLERASGFSIVAWLKIDTGMHRLGFAPGQAPEMMTRLRQCAVVRKLNLITHLAAADNTEDPMTARQFAEFHALSDGFDGDISIANSPAIFAWPEGPAGRRTGKITATSGCVPGSPCTASHRLRRVAGPISGCSRSCSSSAGWSIQNG
ncbi:MAG: alanine racemase [Woeseiaceae bacterium]|nr:alanine racemase [Woeseiaceae bacterium]